MKSFDVIVIGAGIAGVSVAAHLAQTCSVAIVEMEERPAYHTTGRSAALFEPNYGPPSMLAFTRASEAFFRAPPQGFREGALLVPRVSLLFEAEGQQEATAQLLAKGSGLQEIGEAKATELFSVLRSGYASRIFLDAATGDLDVDLIHQGYLRLFRESGGKLLLSAAVTELQGSASGWRVKAGSEVLTAGIIVNAAGAWGDKVAAMAGIRPVGLVPKRRSIGVIPVPEERDAAHWPAVTDVGETWYAKPQSGKLLVSSADATPVEPHDAFADDMAIAEGIERLMTATHLVVDRLDHSWGGLRTFAPDSNPVVGFDTQITSFFWLVGQGGFGIQSCPALSETAARMALGKSPDTAVMDHGLRISDISPQRFNP